MGSDEVPRILCFSRWPSGRCGGGTRTLDLRLMRPTSYHCFTPQVGGVGFEPTHSERPDLQSGAALQLDRPPMLSQIIIFLDLAAASTAPIFILGNPIGRLTVDTIICVSLLCFFVWRAFSTKATYLKHQYCSAYP